MLKNKSIFKFIAVLAVMVMSVCMLTGCGTNSKKDEEKKVEAYEEPVKNFVEGIEEANAEKFLRAFPSFLSDYMKDSFTDDDLKDMLEKAEEDYGANIKMTYKITDKTEISEDDLKEQQDDIKSYYDQDVTISKGYELKIDITTKGDDKEETESDTLEVYEIDGKWCLLDL